jgi:hypothetical protein
MKAISNLQTPKFNSQFFVALAVTVSALLSSLATFAQNAPEKVDVDINTNGGGSVWYGQPWVWAVGVAIFIVIIVAITRSNNSKNA